MRSEKIVWGLILIFVGSIFMLENFNIIEFYWSAVWRFWPVIFILIGANMLLSRFGNKSTTPYLIGGITLAVLALVAFQGSQPRKDRAFEWFRYDNDSKDDRKSWGESNTFTESYSGAKRASLNIQGGATSYRLNDSTSNLFEAVVKQHFGNYTLNKTTSDSIEILNFRMRDKKQSWNLDKMEGNNTLLQMNTNPIWDVKVEMGAGEVIFDLKDYKVNKLTFEGGAASFEAKLGSRMPLTTVAVETGVANVEIEVPTGSGCRIVVDSGLSSKDFNGFTKQSDGTYETKNYNTAKNIINISLKGGLSSFEVKRY